MVVALLCLLLCIAGEARPAGSGFFIVVVGEAVPPGSSFFCLGGVRLGILLPGWVLLRRGLLLGESLVDAVVKLLVRRGVFFGESLFDAVV